MKRFFRVLLWVLGGLLLVLPAGFGLVWACEWHPEECELIFDRESERTEASVKVQTEFPDTVTILSWNTGYAGLGSDMDFFMDGGKRTRASKDRTMENLNKIREFLVSSNADIILLQEVDVSSRRTYGVDQMSFYRNALSEYWSCFARNYKSLFVPVPFGSPMGRVDGGMAVFSKIEPGKAVRYQYPAEYAFPVRLFNLKRCVLSVQFALSGRSFTVNNTHNTAYDTGGMRQKEMEWLRDFLLRDYQGGGVSVTGGDWNQNPPQYTPTPAEVEDPYFSPVVVRDDFLSSEWNFASDASVPTVRYLYEPLSENTTVSVIDFFLSSPGVRCLNVETVDLGFENSDHNPVIAAFVISD